MFEASAGEREALARLYCDTFHDSREYYERFFDLFCAAGEVLFAKRGEEIVSALYLLPQQLWTQERRLDAYYLYAAATLPSARGEGEMGGLIRRAQERCLLRGKSVLLTLPASEGLYGYYARFGFSPLPARTLLTASLREFAGLDGGEPAVRRSLRYEDYLRASARVERCCVRGEETFSLGARNLLEAGGRGAALETRRGAEYALFRPEGADFVLEDGVLSAEGLGCLARELSRERPDAAITLRFQPDGPLPPMLAARCSRERYGMAQAIGETVPEAWIADSYMNLMME